MEDGFELLDQRVRKAAELVKRLRKENKSLEDDLATARGRQKEAEKKLDGLHKELQSSSGRGAEVDALKSDLEALRQEREEVRRRIAKLVTVLEELD
jgi:predicted RNase H-like nuclease (RuvC/YqgF family)